MRSICILQYKKGALVTFSLDKTADRSSLAVLLTTHNRRDQTLECLRGLFDQSILTDARVGVTVFLVDASSTDGTSAMVRAEFPQVQVIDAPSTTYWAAGMRLAQRAAQSRDAAAGELWLNDDVALDRDALQRTIAATAKLGEEAVVIGAMRDDAGEVSYAGFMRGPIWNRLSLRRVAPDAERAVCIDTFNGNYVYLPPGVRQRLGSIGSFFIHGMADIDFGLRARRRGVKVVLLPGTVGVCPYGNPLARADSVVGRLKQKFSPKEYPLVAWAALCFTHGGLAAPFVFLSPYVRSLKPNA